MEQIFDKLLKERDAFYKRGLELSINTHESSSTQEICTAFAKAQSEFLPVRKDTKGHNYKYATLEGLLDVIRPILNKNGLTVSQYTNEKNILHTRLRHISGQWFESRYSLPDTLVDSKRTADQAIGSQLTYMRRYQMLALLGVQPEGEDKDGV